MLFDIPANVKGVARRKVDEQSEANDGRYPPLPLPSCSFSSFGVGGYWGETLTREKRREYEDHLRGLNADQIIEEAFHEMRDAMIPKNSRAGMVLSVLTGIALRKPENRAAGDGCCVSSCWSSLFSLPLDKESFWNGLNDRTETKGDVSNSQGDTLDL